MEIPFLAPWAIRKIASAYFAALFCWLTCLCQPADAHAVTQLYAEWHPSETGWQIEVQFEAGYADPVIREDPDAPAPDRDWLLAQREPGWEKLRAEAERYLRESLVIRAGETDVHWTIAYPDFLKNPPDFPKLLTNGAYFRMILTPEMQFSGPVTLTWRQGETRPDFILKVASTDDGYLTFKPGQNHTIGAPGNVGHGALSTAFIQGFLHVIPKGLDHILFILGLFFYRRRWRALLNQSLAFTAAHTVTLGLAASGIVKVSGNWVEPAIALSLVAVALENLRAAKEKSATPRLLVVFGFGLIHGLGFAGALSSWLKHGEGFLPSLLLANLGVEVAQAALLAAAWLATLGWHGTRAFRIVKIAACLSIAATGIWWTVERISG